MPAGTRVQTTDKVNVRATPDGRRLGAQNKGTQGSIVSGPQTAKGNTWYQVNYDSGVDGWSTAAYLLNLTGGPAPTPTPTPEPAPTSTPPTSGTGPAITLTADPLTVEQNANTGITLAWSVGGATSCNADGPGWNGPVATTGSAMTWITSTGTFTLTCTGSAGTASKSVVVTVNKYVPNPVMTGTYPTSVVKKGLQAVWDLKTTAGIQSAPTLKPSTHASSLPAGTSVNNDYGSNIVVTQSANFNGWDFTGYHVWIYGDIDVTFTNSKFAYSGGTALLSTGSDSGNNPHESTNLNVTVDHSEFDGKGTKAFYESMIRHFAGNLTIKNSYLHDAVIDYVSMGSSGTLTFSNNYVTAPGQGAPADAHIENIHFYIGTSNITNNFIDDRAGSTLGGSTGLLFPEAYTGPETVNVSGNILIGTHALPAYYIAQFGTKNTNTVSFVGNVMESGPNGGYLSTSAVTTSGNVDYETAEDIYPGKGLPAAAGGQDIWSQLNAFYEKAMQLVRKFLYL